MRPRGNRAAALITTLLVIVVLSTVVVAFMQSMAIDRLTAKSASNVLQAELSARAGLQSAVSQLLLAAGTNNEFVTGSTNFSSSNAPVVLIGRANLSDPKQIMPLVSIPPRLLETFLQSEWSDSISGLFADMAGTNSTDVNGRSGMIQSTNTSYRAPWVEISSSSGARIGRYAFVVLDEDARVNPLLHTGTGSMSDPIAWYSGPDDISLTNASALILTPDEQMRMLAMSDRILTPETLAQGFASRNDYERVKHLLTVQKNSTADIIPAGLAERGRPKYNINTLATNPGLTPTQRADQIADIISSNLPSFSSRDPSLRGNAADEVGYLRRLAAGIVDYVDSDAGPTSVNGGEPAGRDLFPLIAAVAERFRLVSIVTNAPIATATIESQCFAQMWNPYTTPIVFNNQELRFVVRNRMLVSFGTGIVTPFDDYDQAVVANLTIGPNEFVVIEFPTVRQTWESPGPVNDIPHWDDGPSGNSDQTTHCPFEFYIGGNLADMNRREPVGPDVAIGGMVRFGLALTDTKNRWQSSFIPTHASAANWRFVGDSRATFLCNYDWQTVGTTGYTTGTRWKGRQQNVAPRHQDFHGHWVQRDYVRSNPSTGAAPASIDQTPSQVATVYDPVNDGSAALAVLANRPMQSIGELGHVFDPAQAADDLSAPNSSEPPVNDKISGGGRTLRIGQPEFKSSSTHSWDTTGRRAIELLDLFTVNQTNANSSGYPTALGRINPNTASEEVLAAILASIKVTSDVGVPEASLSDPARLAADLVSHRPYNSLSDLHKAMQSFADGENYTPGFAVSVGGGTTNLAAADRVREEAFGKLVQHLTVQSRTYRILAVGEAFDASGKARGRAAIEAIVFLKNEAGGEVRPVITFQRSL